MTRSLQERITRQRPVQQESALEEYIRELNIFRRLDQVDEITLPLSREHYEFIQDRLEGDLSPENLACDGLASGSYIAQRHKLLTEVKDELELGGHEDD